MRSTGCSLAVLLLVAGTVACRPAVETEAVEIEEVLAGYCDTAERVTGALDPSPALEPDLGLGPPAVTWTGDLNADGLEDALLRFSEACGNYGECPFVALAACATDDYAMVWGPDYAIDLAVESGETDTGWRVLALEIRNGDQLSRRGLSFEKDVYE